MAHRGWSLAVLVPEKEHGDAPAHDVELAALVPDERERVLGAIGDAVRVQGVDPSRRPALPRRVLPRVALVAGCRLSSVALAHLRRTNHPQTRRNEAPEMPQTEKT